MTEQATSLDRGHLSLRLEGDLAFLRRLARAMLKNPADVDDAVQETIQRALAADLRAVDNPRAWMGRALTNLVRGGWRRQRPSGLLSEVPSDATEPESVALRLERARVLHAELAELPDKYRDVLVHRFGDDLSLAEVAARMGLTETAVNSRLARGKQMLRERLERREGGADQWMYGLLPLAAIPRRAPSPAAAAAGSGPWLLLAAAAATSLLALTTVWLQQSKAQRLPADLARMAAIQAPGTPEVAAASSPARAAAGGTSQTSAPAAPAPEPPETGTLRYAVKDENGHPIAGVRVFVQTALAEGRSAPLMAKVTGPDGSVTFEDLPPGAIKHGQSARHLHGGGDIGAGETLRVSSTIQTAAHPIRVELLGLDEGDSATLWCHFHGGGVGVAQALPIATMEADQLLSLHLRGQARVFATTAGRHPSPSVRIDRWVSERTGDPIPLPLEIGDPAPTVTGHLTDAGGDPVAGGLVVLRSEDKTAVTCTSDTRGAFTSVQGIAGDNLQVEVHASGHALHRSTWTRGPNDPSLEIQLVPERVISGRVVHGDGTAFKGASVVALLSDERYPTSAGFLAGTLWTRPFAKTSDDGAFEIHGLGQEDVELYVEGWNELQECLSTRALVPGALESALDQIITLEPRVLVEGRVLDPQGQALPEIRLDLSLPGQWDTAWTETDEEGAFRIVEPSGGQWPQGQRGKLAICAQYDLGDRHHEMQVDVMELDEIQIGGAPMDIEVPTPAPGNARVKGTLDLTGVPGSFSLHDVSLSFQCRPVTSGISSRGFDTTTGAFDLRGVPAGTYDLFLSSHANGQVILTRTAIEVEAGETLDLGRIAPEGGGSLGITPVSAADGTDLSAEVASTGGWIELRRSPNAMGPRLTFDGATWSSPWPIEPGLWRVRLRRSDWSAAPLEIEIVGGELATDSLQLTPRPASGR